MGGSRARRRRKTAEKKRRIYAVRRITGKYLCTNLTQGEEVATSRIKPMVEKKKEEKSDGLGTERRKRSREGKSEKTRVVKRAASFLSNFGWGSGTAPTD